MRNSNVIVWPAAVAAVGALALIGTASIPAETNSPSAPTSIASYKIDPVHSTMIFRVRHAGASTFYGRFDRIDASKSSFSFDPDNPTTGSFTFVIDNASIDTGNSDRDNHLKTADFFNVAQFPTTSFQSTSVEAAANGMFTLKGNLTLHGVTKPITAELKWIGEGSFRGIPIAGFEASFEIKRSDFAMTKYLDKDGGESGGLGNTVGLLISIEGQRQG